ncbi:MAG: PH domain-containing protein [Chitinophagaceae bacterium]|nr:PH domain-containing protein [Chitinophagaceae bacterium]
MKTYTASRFSEGNKIFPCVLQLDEQSVTYKIPGLFNGKESTIPMSRISSVDIETPMIGYSTIIIETTGEGKIRAHGFTKSEVKEIKAFMLSKIVS